jgi:hypothetical protein
VEESETLEEFEFQKEWAQKQFNEMDSDIAIKLLENAIDKGKNLRMFLKDRWKIAQELGQRLIEKGIIKVAEEEPNLSALYKNALAIGIDSSRQLPLRILSTYYCPITSAIVYFKGINGKMEYDPNSPSIFLEENNITPDEALIKAREEMYRCEVSAIARVASSINSLLRESNKERVLVMIDGPIIDPPNTKLYSRYINERVNAILACKESGALVIGCVKNMEGCHFLNFLKNHPELSELATTAQGFGPDPQLVPLIFFGIRSIGSILETIPIERYEPQELVAEYKKHGLKNFYRLYLTKSSRGNLMCVEYFTLEGEDAVKVGKEVCQAVRVWTMPGHNVPLPVLAAHRRCNIKRGSAEFLYRELLTRALSWEGGAEIFGPLSGVS